MHRDGTGDSIDHAGKFDQQPVAGRFDDTSAISGNRRIDSSLRAALSARSVPTSSAPIIAAVADNVHGENRGKFSVDVLVLIQTEGLHRRGYLIPQEAARCRIKAEVKIWALGGPPSSRLLARGTLEIRPLFRCVKSACGTAPVHDRMIE